MSLHVIFQVIFGHEQDWSAPGRLDEELAYLTEITLPSLAAQTNRNFRVLILCSDTHDEDTRNRIRHAIWGRIEQWRAKPIFRGPGDAAAQMTRSTNGRWDNRTWRVQVALDHDAAVASDYVERLRSAAATRIKRMKAPDDYRFLAFASHYALELGGQTGDAQLYAKPARRGDAGLALLSAHGSKMSPHSFRGKAISAEHPIDLLGGSKPFVLAMLCDRSIRIARNVAAPGDDRALRDAAKRFGWLGRALDSLPLNRIQ